MTRKASCTACTFIVNGVKTRKAIPHTCGKTDKEIRTLMDSIKKNQKNIDETIKNKTNEIRKNQGHTKT